MSISNIEGNIAVSILADAVLAEGLSFQRAKVAFVKCGAPNVFPDVFLMGPFLSFFQHL